MSRFLKVYFSAFLILPLVVLFNVVINPYGLYPLIEIEGINWPKPEAINSVKMHKAYRISQVKPETIVIGTSRSAFGIDPESDAWGDTFQPRYNFSLSGAGMYVTRRFLEHAHTVHPLKRVVFGLDFFTFNIYRQKASDYRVDFLSVDDGGGLNRNYKNEILNATLLSTDAIMASYKTITSKVKTPVAVTREGMFFLPTAKQHSHESFLGSEYLYFSKVYLVGSKRDYAFYNQDTNDSSLDEFRKIVVYCKEHQIDLKLFISPLHARHQEVIRVLGLWPKFERWKRELLQILQGEGHESELWDFSGYNSITAVDIFAEGELNYIDSTHYLPRLGHMILSRLLRTDGVYVPNDFGHVLTPDNIEEKLELFRSEQKKFRVDYPRQVEEIEAMADKDYKLEDALKIIKKHEL